VSSAPANPHGDLRTGHALTPESEREAERETSPASANDHPERDASQGTEHEQPGQAAAATELTSDEAESSEAMLTPLEARVLGCLMEKQRTTPDQYPLTLNALVTACNQKSARDPVMKLTPGEVGHCVGQLRDRGLVHAGFTGRSERFDHKLTGHFMLDRQQQALLCVLMLRGPQTPGELRTHSTRLADFGSLAAVQTTLDQLAHHNPPLVRELEREGGRREQRFAHLLCGEPRLEPRNQAASTAKAAAASPPGAISIEDWETLVDRVERLEAEVEALKGN
jgi:uncharacterized protein YceH (UPF0502 family)